MGLLEVDVLLLLQLDNRGQQCQMKHQVCVHFIASLACKRLSDDLSERKQQKMKTFVFYHMI